MSVSYTHLGGVDVIGMWAARKFKNASVGKISLYVNVVVYASCLLYTSRRAISHH